MKKRFVFAVVCVFFLLFTCINAVAPFGEGQKGVEVWQEEKVSPVAIKNYLDFETSSWAREYPPEFVMIHFMSAVSISQEDPYNPELVREIFERDEIGINYIIHRDGTVECYLPENRAAWHAGTGRITGDDKYTDKMNMYSIGIELVGMGSQEEMLQYIDASEYESFGSDFYGFTDAQYDSLKILVEDICDRYSLPVDRNHILGHDEYSEDKVDPGELFDWSRIM